jgi:hypothetical protein
LERKNAKCDGCACKCKWQIEEDIIRTYQLEYLFLSILSFTSFSVFIRIYNLLSGFHSDGNRLLASAINAQLLPLTLPTAFVILSPSSPRHTHPQGRNRRKQRKDDRLQRLDALLLRDGAHDEGEHRAAWAAEGRAKADGADVERAGEEFGDQDDGWQVISVVISAILDRERAGEQKTDELYTLV